MLEIIAWVAAWIAASWLVCSFIDFLIERRSPRDAYEGKR